MIGGSLRGGENSCSFIFGIFLFLSLIKISIFMSPRTSLLFLIAVKSCFSLYTPCTATGFKQKLSEEEEAVSRCVCLISRGLDLHSSSSVCALVFHCNNKTAITTFRICSIILLL